MKTEFKEIMINKGDIIKCLHTITINNIEYFTEGKEYTSDGDNCLINNQGESNFVQQYYLSYFFK